MGSRRSPSFSRWYKELTSFAGSLWTGYGSRLRVFLTMTLLCLILGENYPFSNFPMYSSFAKKSYLIYLADAAGRPLPTNRFGLSNPTLKKIFSSRRAGQFAKVNRGEMSAAEIDKTAALAVFNHLDELYPAGVRQRASLRGVELRRVNILWTHGRISFSTETLAQHP